MMTWDHFKNLACPAHITTMLFMFAAMVLLQIAVDLKNGTWRLKPMLATLEQMAVMAIAYVGVICWAMADSTIDTLVVAVFSFIVALLGAQILASLNALGLPIPAALRWLHEDKPKPPPGPAIVPPGGYTK
jgi:hypothetical protein